MNDEDVMLNNWYLVKMNERTNGHHHQLDGALVQVVRIEEWDSHSHHTTYFLQIHPDHEYGDKFWARPDFQLPASCLTELPVNGPTKEEWEAMRVSLAAMLEEL